MKKFVLTTVTFAFGFLKINAQVIPVNPTTFAGHYYTEQKMAKKKEEIDFIFDETRGALIGTVKGLESSSDKVVFTSDALKKGWAADSKIWIWDNGNGNRMAYGKEMFNESDLTMATFIEEGVIVLFKQYGGKNKKIKMYDVDTNEVSIRIIAKDKTKLSMNKKEAAKKADETLNAAGGAQMKKRFDDATKGAWSVPVETLSKTDKALKKEVVEFFMSIPLHPEDQTDFICAYTTGNDWTIITNKATGAILGREIMAEMIRKGKESGKCRRNPYLLYEQYNGMGYGKVTFKTKYEQVECDCSQIDKNK